MEEYQKIKTTIKDWDEADRYIDLWDKVWYAKFVKVVYDYDAEV